MMSVFPPPDVRNGSTVSQFNNVTSDRGTVEMYNLKTASEINTLICHLFITVKSLIEPHI